MNICTTLYLKPVTIEDVKILCGVKLTLIQRLHQDISYDMYKEGLIDASVLKKLYLSFPYIPLTVFFRVAVNSCKTGTLHEEGNSGDLMYEKVS